MMFNIYVEGVKIIVKSWKFPKYLGIWGIPQMPGNLENSANTWESGILPKYHFVKTKNKNDIKFYVE